MVLMLHPIYVFWGDNMGLDNFASSVPDDLVLSEDDEKAFEEAGIELCGGILSGGGSSFRGKVYSDLFTAVTNKSPYNDWLPPETVKKMSEALSKHTPKELVVINKKENAYDDHTEDEMVGLQKFFRVCAERGLDIIGWS